MKVKIKQKKGSILAFALLVVGMMFAAVLSISVITTSEKKGASGTEASTQAYQAADTAVQDAMYKINTEIRTSSLSGPSTKINNLFGASCVYSGNVAGADYKVFFFSDAAGLQQINCSNDTDIISKIKSIKATGIYKGTVRSVSVVLKTPIVSCDSSSFSCGSDCSYNGDVYSTGQFNPGSKCWMTKNMNTKYLSDGTTNANRKCYNNDVNNCTIYGGLYFWDDAMAICPNKWHLAKISDWGGGSPLVSGLTTKYTYDELKTGGTSGFNAQLGGYYSNFITFKGFYWSSDTNWSALPYGITFDGGSVTNTTTFPKATGSSVRCVLD